MRNFAATRSYNRAVQCRACWVVAAQNQCVIADWFPSQDSCFATPCANRLPQSIARQKIHPFQYLMVGAALCVFYLLLLSISEFIGFSWAYLVAAVASTLLITWYCRFFLGGGVRTFMICAGLAGVNLFLYITLRQQDYALLMGAIALFVVLAIVMYVTRKVDWYARDAG